jgi:hypothetical protein
MSGPELQLVEEDARIIVTVHKTRRDERLTPSCNSARRSVRSGGAQGAEAGSIARHTGEGTETT